MKHRIKLLWLLVVVVATFGTVASAFVSQFRRFALGTTATRGPVARQAGYLELPKTIHPDLRQQRNENSEAETLVTASSQQKGEEEEDGWIDAKIVSSRPACSSGKSTVIFLEVGTETYQKYTTPGQFVQLKYKDNDPIFLAIASAPGTGTNADGTAAPNRCFEFLIKMSPRLSWLPEALIEGTRVQVSSVMGEGFPLGDLINTAKNVNQIILAAAGSGIAPLKACIESGKLTRSSSQARDENKLYYGEWTQDDMCYTDLYESWNAKWGVEVVPVLSRTDDSKRYVQTALKQDPVLSSRSPESIGAILCGMDAMVEDCTSVLTEVGVPSDNILLNL